MTEQDESLRLFVILSKAYWAVEKHARRSIAKSGLNPTEFAVLELLYHRGPTPMQQIGEKILIASGSITYVVDKLEQKELAVREPSKDDRRISYAVITEKGKRLMDAFFPQHRDDIHAAMEGLTSEEKRTLAEALKRLGLTAQENG